VKPLGGHEQMQKTGHTAYAAIAVIHRKLIGRVHLEPYRAAVAGTAVSYEFHGVNYTGDMLTHESISAEMDQPSGGGVRSRMAPTAA
jgi:hypothetical protein